MVHAGETKRERDNQREIERKIKEEETKKALTVLRVF